MTKRITINSWGIRGNLSVPAYCIMQDESIGGMGETIHAEDQLDAIKRAICAKTSREIGGHVICRSGRMCSEARDWSEADWQLTFTRPNGAVVGECTVRVERNI